MQDYALINDDFVLLLDFDTDFVVYMTSFVYNMHVHSLIPLGHMYVRTTFLNFWVAINILIDREETLIYNSDNTSQT